MSVQIIYELNILWKGKSIKMLHQKAFQPNVHSLKLTFWSDFSFSSKFLVAVSRLVWVCDNSFSSCCIFFSNASTSSLAFLWFFLSRHMAFYEDGWRQSRKKREKKREINKKLVKTTYNLKGFVFLLECTVCVHEFFLRWIEVVLHCVHPFLQIANFLFGLGN